MAHAGFTAFSAQSGGRDRSRPSISSYPILIQNVEILEGVVPS